MTQPPDNIIRIALEQAAQSPCRSKRGAVIYCDGPAAGHLFLGAGFNGPPGGRCPGRAICAGNCGQRSVHAEVRAIRNVQWPHPKSSDLVHVELAPGPYAIDVERSADGLPIGQAPHIISGEVVACDGPSCPGCAAQILDVGFVGGVWLYEARPANVIGDGAGTGARVNLASWHRYTAAEFYEVTMRRVQA